MSHARGLRVEPPSKLIRLRISVLGRPRAEFHQQAAAAHRQQLQLVEAHAFGVQRIDDLSVEAFETDRFVRQDGRHVIGGDERIGKTHTYQAPERRTGHQAKLGFQYGRARALGSHQRAGDMKSVFGKQLVEVVAGDAPRNARVLLPDERRISIANLLQARINLPLPSTGRDDALQIGVRGFPHRHFGAVVQHDTERVDVVDGFPAHQRVHAAGVVADHAAERAPAVRRRIGSERQVVPLRRIAQSIEYDAGLHARDERLRIQMDQPVHVLRKIEDDRHVAELAGQARASAARQDRRAQFATGGQRGFHVCVIERNDEAYGNVPVVRRIGRVKRARPIVKAHFTANDIPEAPQELAARRKPFACAGV